MGKTGAIPQVDGLTREDGERPCPVCRRAPAGCICKSHVPVRALPADADVLPPIVTRPYPDAYIESLVNEFMVLFYYERNADGAAQWLRKHLR